MIDVSIVIVCMNRLDNLYPCLRSIQQHCHLRYEVLVVAYLFTKDNWDAATSDFPWVQFIESQQVRGFSENNNLALQRVQGRYCFILNDDTEMHSDVIGQLYHDFSLLPDNTAIVTPTLLNRDASLQLCGRPPYPAYKYVLQQWHLYREHLDDTIGKNAYTAQLYPTSNISGAAFLIKTDIFRRLGWFDEEYFFTPEDIALSTLARERGYGVYVDKAASIVHKWRTTASKISVAVRPASIRGSLIFFSRGSSLRYLLLGLGVWTAEWGKYLKASFMVLIASLTYTRTCQTQIAMAEKKQVFPKNIEQVRLQRDTYRANCHAIFTHKTPKELFILHKDNAASRHS